MIKVVLFFATILLIINCGNKSIENINLTISKEKADSIIGQVFCLNSNDSLLSQKCKREISYYDFERYHFDPIKRVHYYFISRWEGFIVGGVFVGVIGCFTENQNGKFIQNQGIADFYSENLKKPLAIFEKIKAKQTLLKSDNSGQEISIHFYEFSDTLNICCIFEK